MAQTECTSLLVPTLKFGSQLVARLIKGYPQYE
jgi:hypothetical protein